MALDFQALQVEFYARGFNYLNDGGAGVTRAKRFLNDAMHMIDEMEDWPYLNASTTGTSPLTIADLRKVEAVLDTTNDQILPQATRAEAMMYSGDLTTTGSLPYCYYVTGGTTITLYPVSTTVQLSVLYWKFGPDLSANGDTPLMPDRYRYAIVEYAVAAALREESGETAIPQQAGDLLVDKMRTWAGFLQPRATYIPLVGEDS